MRSWSTGVELQATRRQRASVMGREPDVLQEEDVAEILPEVVREIRRDALRARRLTSRRIDLDGGVELEDVAGAWPAAVRGAVRDAAIAVVADRIYAALRSYRSQR